jgi:hypothetical protein
MPVMASSVHSTRGRNILRAANLTFYRPLQLRAADWRPRPSQIQSVSSRMPSRLGDNKEELACRRALQRNGTIPVASATVGAFPDGPVRLIDPFGAGGGPISSVAPRRHPQQPIR